MTDPKPAAPTAHGILGLIIDINGYMVTVNSDTIADIDKNGLEMGITVPVKLGTFQDMIRYINDTFLTPTGLPTIPTDASSLPEPLPTIIGKVEGLEVTILKAHFKIPPKTAADQTVLYTLVMNVSEETGDAISFGLLGVKGAVIGVTNETQTPAASTPPPPAGS